MTPWVSFPLSQNRFKTPGEVLHGLTYIDSPKAFVLLIGADNYKVETIFVNSVGASLIKGYVANRFNPNSEVSVVSMCILWGHSVRRGGCPYAPPHKLETDWAGECAGAMI